MRNKLIAVFAVLVIALTAVVPAGAITGGQPDGDMHPYSGLVLVPETGFCSGTLIAPTVVLTAGHCTDFFSDPEFGITQVYVTFDSQASVDLETWAITGGTWYTATAWHTHPDYVSDDWPFTADYGVVILDQAVTDITPAVLPEPYALDDMLSTTGQTDQRFNDVGYGQSGVTVGGGPYVQNFEFIRKYSVQRYNPSNGAVGTQDPLWLMLQSSPSANKGGGCGGDSGSGVFPAGEDTVVAIHVGGFHMGFHDRLCGRMTSLNMRVDLPIAMDWLATFLD